MAESAAASVVVPFLQPLFMRLSSMFVVHFLEVVNETLMKLPSNPSNGIPNNCRLKAVGTISLFS